MVGLFIDHGGFSANVPSARFGNISMLPNTNAPIKQSTGYNGPCYIIDMHSRTGFSDSRVYVYPTFGSDLTSYFGHSFDELDIDDMNVGYAEGSRPRIRGRLRVANLFKLLGIHWEQFPERWQLHDKGSLREARNDLILEGGYVEGLSGMTCVIPAWKILEVLNMPAIKTLRHSDLRVKRSSVIQPKP